MSTLILRNPTVSIEAALEQYGPAPKGALLREPGDYWLLALLSGHATVKVEGFSDEYRARLAYTRFVGRLFGTAAKLGAK